MEKATYRTTRGRRVLLLTVLLMGVNSLSLAGEFKIGRYIEPNQMSKIFTRHVRKGIIKRIGLTDTQLQQIRKVIDPHRDSVLEQITEFKDARIELVYAVAEEPFSAERVRAAHAAAASGELELTLTAGVIISELRTVLTKEQLREVNEMMEEVRQASELRFADFTEKIAAGELLGLEPYPAAPKPGGSP